MAGQSALVEHLGWLIKELIAEIDELGTSSLNEPEEPIPIRGRPLYEAVQAVEQHYGGGLPIERSDKLPVDARRAWKDMLLAADHGEGRDDPRARNRTYYKNCQSLCEWARAELAQQATDDEGQTGPTRTPNRRGRKKASYTTEQKEAKLADDWKRSHGTGTYKADFAKQKRMTPKDLARLLDRVRKRKARSDE